MINLFIFEKEDLYFNGFACGFKDPIFVVFVCQLFALQSEISF